MGNRFQGLDLIPPQTAVLKPDGRIIFVNDAWNKFAESNGYTGTDFVGLNYLGVCAAAEGAEKPQATYFARNLRAVLNGTIPGFELVYPCHGFDIKRWFKGIAKNHGGQTVVTHVDISLEHGHFQHAVQFYENAKIMHDLRSPLTAILGFSEVAAALPARHQNWDKALEYFDLIRTSGTRMLEVVNEILDFSGETNLKESQTDTTVSLHLLSQEIQKMLLPLSKQDGVRLDLDISEELALHGDEKKLWKIFTNLASNAVKYNRPNGSVTISASLNGSGGIEVRVADSGVGMASEAINTIFEPFTRLGDGTPANPREGTGLGLAIVRDLVHEHDGNIVVRSTVNAGTEFIVQFPAWRTVVGKKSLVA